MSDVSRVQWVIGKIRDIVGGITSFMFFGLVLSGVMAIERTFISHDGSEGKLVLFIIGAGVIAFGLASSALWLANKILRFLVEAVLVLVVLVDFLAVYVVLRMWYAGAPWFPWTEARTLTNVIVAVLVLFVANVILAATLIPAMRAAGIDPRMYYRRQAAPEGSPATALSTAPNPGPQPDGTAGAAPRG